MLKKTQLRGGHRPIEVEKPYFVTAEDIDPGGDEGVTGTTGIKD